MSVEVRIYSARGCHLCDEARLVLERERRERPFDLVEVDITGDAELEAAYREDIPVVLVAGRRTFTYHVDPAVLREHLDALAGGG